MFFLLSLYQILIIMNLIELETILRDRQREDIAVDDTIIKIIPAYEWLREEK